MSKIQHESCYGIIPLQQKGTDWHVLLLCHTKGHFWGFPKGHPEVNETELQAATRELTEETSLSIVEILPFLPIKVSFQFERGKDKIHKTVLYYIAKVEGEICIDQKEICEARWVSFDEAERLITYPVDKETMKQVINDITTL